MTKIGSERKLYDMPGNSIIIHIIVWQSFGKSGASVHRFRIKANKYSVGAIFVPSKSLIVNTMRKKEI